MRCGHAVRFFLLLSGLFAAASAEADDYAVRCPLKDLYPSITTTGTASAEVSPDLAMISLGVMTERPKAADAARENATASQALVAEIKAQGIDPRDIKTVSVSLTPVYDEIRDDGRGSRRVLRGYVARNDLTVRLRQIDKAGAFVARLIERGANRVEAITFDLEDKEARLEALRGEAVRDALRKATSYVNGLGIKLGRVLSIAPPSHVMRPQPALQMARAAPDVGAAIAIEPGVETLHAEVEVTWELAQ
jgi:uncharacterized protein YggE